MAARVKAAGVKLMIQVQSVQQAIDAVSLGADAIVAQVCQPPDWTSSCPLQSDLCAASEDSNFPGQVHVNQADLPEYATAKIQSNVHWRGPLAKFEMTMQLSCWGLIQRL